MSCEVLANTPMNSPANSNTASESAVANTTDITAHPAMRARMSFFLSMRSPSGVRNAMPEAKPTCASVGSQPICAGEAPNSAAISAIIGV